nr:zinc finger protein Dzip1-like [Danaus plexippus plexippus]
MACKTTFELHHNFPKLAEESGFTFNTHKPRVHIEWRKIKLIDIENIIRDRKFVVIEQHINDVSSDIFNSSAQLDAMQYNKCNYCEKVFMNQLYLKSHISRRHEQVLEIPQKDITDNNQSTDNMNAKLNNEIAELKTKLKQMEELMENMQKCNDATKEEASSSTLAVKISNVNEEKISNTQTKEMKDVEVIANEEGCILDKIEEWKKEEHNKYNEEIKLLRQQIIDIISNKDKQDHISIKNELKLMEELQNTIKQQGDEILSLKDKLLNEQNNEVEKRKEIETQMAYWVKRAEMQSNEYKSLLQKLNEVAHEAREYKVKAETEKEKADNLQKLLLQQQYDTSPKRNQRSQNKDSHDEKNTEDKIEKDESEKSMNIQITNPHKSPTADILTLKKLQQKAQELLNIDQSTTSDNSITSDHKSKSKQSNKENKISNKKRRKRKDPILINSKRNFKTHENGGNLQKKDIVEKKVKTKSKTIDQGSKKINGFAHTPASPIKVVRAKITEEVNNRLITLGVDPLKNRIPQNVFKKQRKNLLEQQQAKTKKIPSRERIMHSIITHLDENATNASYDKRFQEVSPNKSKTFSLSSVLSNVKTKALSLVKQNEANNKFNKTQDDLAKTAIALLKTPPESINSSPVIQRRANFNLSNKTVGEMKENQKSSSRQKSKLLPLTRNARHENEHEESSTESTENSEYNDQHESNLDNTSKIINNLIKSPVRKPTDNVTTSLDVNRKNVTSPKSQGINLDKTSVMDTSKISSDDIESISSPKKNSSLDNISNTKQTKGVLKSASSISSLNKKKVLFDMDAIQMKLMSASPSQSITDKSDKNDQYVLGIENLDTEEWDISSIENEPANTTAKIQISTRTSPKIAELKQTIESQLTKRNPKLSTTIVGGVDVLATPIQKASFGGSNTSLGSSILDDDSLPLPTRNAFVKPKKVTEKDDSEIEISDLIENSMSNKKYNK